MKMSFPDIDAKRMIELNQKGCNKTELLNKVAVITIQSKGTVNFSSNGVLFPLFDSHHIIRTHCNPTLRNHMPKTYLLMP